MDCNGTYDGMNTDCNDEGMTVDPSKDANAKSPILVASVLIHTLVRVLSPGVQAFKSVAIRFLRTYHYTTLTSNFADNGGARRRASGNHSMIELELLTEAFKL